jgi:hypothetical protein
MKRVRLLLVAVLAGTLASTALAANGNPRAAHTAVGSASATAALVRRSDLPKGWKGSAPPKVATTSKLCRGLRPNQSDLVETGFAVAPDFSLGQTASVTQWVRAFRSAKQADTSWSRTVTIGLVTCLARQLEAASNAKSKVTVTGQYRLQVPKAARRAAGFRVVAHAVTPDDKFNVYADVVVVQQGNRITTMTFTGFVQPFDAALQDKLVRTVGARLGGKPAAA